MPLCSTKKAFAIFFLFFLVLLLLSNVHSFDDPDLSVFEDDIYFSKLNPVTEEEITIYAQIHNTGSQTTAVVRFYEGYEKNLIGEDKIVVYEKSTTLASVNWQPNYGAYNILVSIEDVKPADANLGNNEAKTTAVFYIGTSALELETGYATIEEEIERIIPISVKANQNLDNVNLDIIYQGDLNLTLMLPSQNISIRAGEIAKFYIKIKAPKINNNENRESRTVLLQASNNEFLSNIAELEISIHPSVEESNWWNTTVAACACGTIGIFAAIGGTEIGKYKFLSFVLPLYTKLNKEEILDHYTRGKIHGYILANPGDHYNSIKKALDISNGSFAYHLHVLEREGVIKSKRDGIYRRFYPSEMRLPSNANHLKEIQKLIIERIKESPGMSQTDIASSLGVASSTIHYHIQDLISADLVEAKRMGRSVRYFPNDGIIEVSCL
ncbi:MAG: winged helix-turn-helix transcriptional regulator [Thermoplasmata archaeon]|nr:MAG: winged helix-turn-helix transcriptional regulator [Thermoplasmata archaeon]